MTISKKFNWPPINHAFENEDYPYSIQSIAVNADITLDAWAKDTARKILALGIVEGFQITTKKSGPMDILQIRFKNFSDNVAVAAILFPTTDEYMCYDTPDFLISPEAHMKAAEEFCERFGISARIKKNDNPNNKMNPLVLKFRDSVDAAAYVHARSKDGGFIKVRAREIDREMKQTQDNQPVISRSAATRDLHR